MTMQVLFAIGSNGSGQLGIGHKEDVSVPKPVLLPEETASPPPSITSIAGGGNHTLLLTSSGTLYWAGDPAPGACGPTQSSQLSAPPQFHPVDLSTVSSPVTHIAATWEASVIVVDGGRKVYTFGVGLKGELGLGPLIMRTPVPSLVKDFPPAGRRVVDLAASMAHTAVVLDDGSAWGWGAGRKGQLGGSPEASAVVDAPRRIEVRFPVARVVCGKEFTCLFGAPEKGEFEVIGSEKWDIKTGAPAAGRIADWEDVGAGWGNVFVLKGDENVVSWGRNDHGQLTPEHLPQAERIAVGSEHALALTKEGDVMAWGWGEHGNCGPMPSGNGDAHQKGSAIASTKYVPAGAKITVIGAGCATSWVGIDMPTPA
ncbi:regulator of chromosome condensation 1/beta-lactamase-inhibitor protein II [Podospora aff. communis PSN243]|uniref:Regulator of chromosome condensation 1/beta-lactamase-inhibitor protein II n=1 Tax=Podospora aff. communis PSN243 TaxID=3040156 RepID=A0AAV9H839_9PEZI|nr:regulator of chromosome condensation 1/beta-lactamase-inhibitor protein II [Podospora aff. communis PSN243]